MSDYRIMANGGVAGMLGPVGVGIGPGFGEAGGEGRRRRRSIGFVVCERLAGEVGEFLRQDASLDAEVPDSVHRARRAARRLRAAIRLFRRYLDRRWAEGLEAEVRWLARQLGAVRDLDVVGERLFADEPSEVMGRIREAFEAKRRMARVALAESLGSRRREILGETLREACRHPRLRGELTKPARKRLRRRLRVLWHRLLAARDCAREAPSDEAYHEVRKRGKDLRLALEMAAPELGSRRAVERLDRALGRLVSRLGERQDAVVAGGLIRELDAGVGGGTPERGAAVARLAARFGEEIARVDAEFAEAWRRVRRAARDLLGE